MHGATTEFYPFFQCALMRVKACKGGKKRGMDIQHAPRPLQGKFRREQPHEASKANIVDVVGQQLMLHGFVKCGARRKLGMLDQFNWHARFCCTCQPIGVGFIANDQSNFCRIVRERTRIKQGLKVRAVAGNKHRHPCAAHKRPV